MYQLGHPDNYLFALSKNIIFWIKLKQQQIDLENKISDGIHGNLTWQGWLSRWVNWPSVFLFSIGSVNPKSVDFNCKNNVFWMKIHCTHLTQFWKPNHWSQPPRSKPQGRLSCRVNWRSVFLFQPIHRFDHRANDLFPLYNLILMVSKCPGNIMTA